LDISKLESRPVGTLVGRVSESLREAIRSGEFAPGDKLPSEAQLTARHGVSRTVVREAIALLRTDGLVMPRQGAGVFVLPSEPSRTTPRAIDKSKLSSVLELLEVRTPLEAEAAALAAMRRSPSQEEEILVRHSTIVELAEAGRSIREADFALHLAIADATNNPRFREFLIVHGPEAIPNSEIVTNRQSDLERNYHRQLIEEHEKIVLAISRRDEAGAREAMLHHLKGSQARHRELLHQIRVGHFAAD
jgi:GntR family transcriptional repressor for pyruvate dehydrogenase complex